MNLATRIENADKELLALKDSLIESTKLLEATPEEESFLAQVEELSAKVEKQTNTVNALKKAQDALAARATPVNAPAIVGSHVVAKQAQGDDIIFQMATAKFLSFAQKKDINQVIEERYKGNQGLAAAIEYTSKSVVNPAMTTVAGWAQELTQQGYSAFLESVKSTSVAAALAPRTTMLNFGGFNSLTVPRRNNLPAGSTLTEPSFVGEAGAIPLTQFSFGSATINRYKLAAITTMSREIADRSTPAIEGLLRVALREAYSEVLDAAFLGSSAAVANVRPAGLLNALVAGTGTAGGGQAAVIADIKALYNGMIAANLGSRPVLLMNEADRVSAGFMVTSLGERVFADELMAGRLMGMEVISSTNVPKGTLILVDASCLATAFDVPEFEVSDVATVVESNANATAPTMAAVAAQPAVGAVGTAGQVPVNSGIAVAGSTGAATTGFQARSLWQTYSVGIRMVAPTSWAQLRSGGVAYTTGLTW